MIALELTYDAARAAVFQRDGLICQYCGTTGATSYIMEHVVPQRMGGPTHLFNLVVACKGCNHSKGSTVWIPGNLDSITAEHPEWAQYVRTLAAECEAAAGPDPNLITFSARGVDREIARRVRIYATTTEQNIGAIVTAALREYMARHDA